MRYIIALFLLALAAVAPALAVQPSVPEPLPAPEPFASPWDTGTPAYTSIVDAPATPVPSGEAANATGNDSAAAGGEIPALRYVNETHGYAINYPDTWTAEERDVGVTFVSPPPSAAVVIYAKQAADDYNATDTDEEVLEAESDVVPADLAQAYDDFAMTETFYYESDVAPIYEYLYTGTLVDGTAIRGDTLLFVREGTVYTIEYVAPAENYDARAAEFAGMLQSFEFT